MAASDSAPIPDKSLTQQQRELAGEILEILGIERREIGADRYDRLRAAIAHYTVTICIERGAVS